ncbi:unnamed protein product [Heligmosomoides polygyrus]|uniref:Integrase_H2C2 domain-containing protein n=1 Tax=Heligmosomoides polygyrus TaxID=6339 RepID=A0A183FQD9_HELPZ|nr:unnamed protein product [Heligmosomoides polygyrus]
MMHSTHGFKSPISFYYQTLKSPKLDPQHSKSYSSRHYEQRRKILKQLKLQADNHGILHCRGRLNNANLTFNTRQPIFIQTKTPLSEAIVRENHTPLHCGIAHTIANVRRKYWIPKLRQLARRVIQGCVICQRMNNLPYRIRRNAQQSATHLPGRTLGRSTDLTTDRFHPSGIEVTFPFENTRGEHEDHSYLPPDEAIRLQTRRQAEEALRSSHRYAERFWNIWSQEYLTSLRESHKLEVSKQRSGNKEPKVGKVVLISDPVLPRNSWKIARITDLKPASGAVREALLKIPNGRTISINSCHWNSTTKTRIAFSIFPFIFHFIVGGHGRRDYNPGEPAEATIRLASSDVPAIRLASADVAATHLASADVPATHLASADVPATRLAPSDVTATGLAPSDDD